jgi:creatinine amidohydrolase
VGDYKAAKPVQQGMAFAPAAQGWITRERTTPGHIGSPHLATAEKGEHLFRAFAQGVVSFLERVASVK